MNKKATGYKPKYGMLSCVKYMYKMLWKTERGLVLSAIASIPISLVLSAIAMYTPAVVLSVLEMSQQFSYIALVIVGLLIIKLVFDLMQNIISAKMEFARHRINNQILARCQCKRRDRDWNHEFNLETQKSELVTYLQQISAL